MALFYSLLLAFCCYISLSYEAATGPVAETADGKKIVACYYTTWSHQRKSPYGMTPKNIDPFLCTHIIYAFGDIGDNNIISPDPSYDIEEGAYEKLTGLKSQNPALKVMISLGGWSAGTKGFAKISANETDRTEFAKNAAKYLREYGFDGLDLNWQHPTFREGGKEEDKENYVLLSKALREEFDKEAKTSGKPKLLLSVAITHNQKFLPAYDLANLNKYMDFISVICYDYHFSYETAVNHHSPLYAIDEGKEDSKINSNYTIHFFMKFVEPSKLLLGIPTYGRSYKLENSGERGLGSPADGAAEKGPYTGEKGFFSFYEICDFVKHQNWTVVQQKPGAVGPYAYKGDQWVGYDDVESTKNKAVYAKQTGLGGVMFWTMDFDDFVGSCMGKKNPVITAARDVLVKPNSPVKTLPSTETKLPSGAI